MMVGALLRNGREAECYGRTPMSFARFNVLNSAIEQYHLMRVRVASFVSRLPTRSTCNPPGDVRPASAPSPTRTCRAQEFDPYGCDPCRWTSWAREVRLERMPSLFIQSDSDEILGPHKIGGQGCGLCMGMVPRDRSICPTESFAFK